MRMQSVPDPSIQRIKSCSSSSSRRRPQTRNPGPIHGWVVEPRQTFPSQFKGKAPLLGNECKKALRRSSFMLPPRPLRPCLPRSKLTHSKAYSTRTPSATAFWSVFFPPQSSCTISNRAVFLAFCALAGLH